MATSLALFAGLHPAPLSSRLDWRTRAISQYAALDGWAFDAATLLLVAESPAVLAARVRAALIRRAAAWSQRVPRALSRAIGRMRER